MWKLAIEDDQGNRTVVNLVRSEYAIGRSEENAVRLTERNISRSHASISKTGTGWVLTDLNSYNGCFVNGARITAPKQLEHGDLVQLGDYRLEVIDEASRSLDSATATVPVGPKSQSLVGQPDRLVMLVGPAPGAEFPLTGPSLVVGRGEECDLQLNHSSVSRVHAEVHAIGDGRYEIIDRDSANGVRVNGSELERSLLDARDTIELGDVVLKFIPAGQIYRPGVDDTQQFGFSPVREAQPSPAGGSVRVGGKSRALKITGVLAGLGLIAVLAVMALSRSSAPPVAEPHAAAPAPDPAAKTLSEAIEMLERGDVEGAHQKVTSELSEGSAARQSPEFQRVQTRWGDTVFERASTEADAAKKRALLEELKDAPGITPAQRDRALNELAMLDAQRVDVSELPSAPAPSASQPARAPRHRAPAQAARPQAQPRAALENPYTQQAEEATPQPDAPPAEDEAAAAERARVARAKAILENKVISGRATEQELRMFKALCRQLGDASCSQ